jgi:hypothetical protein
MAGLRSLEEAYQALLDVCLSQEQALKRLDTDEWLVLMAARESCFAHVEACQAEWHAADEATRGGVRRVIAAILAVDARMQMPLQHIMADIAKDLAHIQRGGSALSAYQAGATPEALFMDQSG